MVHRDAELAYQELVRRRHGKEISENQFYDEVNKMQVVDDAGNYWQLRASDGAWLRWNGSAWQEVARPVQQGHNQTNPGAPQHFPNHPAAAQPQQAAAHNQGPQSILGLLGTLLKSFLVSLPKRVIITLVIFGLSWFFHTFLLAYVNDGYFYVKHPVLGMILSMQIDVRGGVYFWTISAMLLSILVCRARTEGVGALFSKIFRVPSTMISYIKTPDFRGGSYLLGGAAVAIIFGLTFSQEGVLHHSAQAATREVVIHNRMLALAFFLSIIVALSNQYNGFAFLVGRLAHQDARKVLPGLFKPHFDPRIIYSLLSGLAIGFLAMILLPFLPYTGYILAVLFIALAAIMQFSSTPVQGAYLLIIAAAVTAYFIPPIQEALACYGGFHEYGGTLNSWLNNPSGNAPTTMQHGIPPAIGAAIGASLPPLVSGLIPGINWPGQNGPDYTGDYPVQPEPYGHEPVHEPSTPDVPSEQEHPGDPDKLVTPGNGKTSYDFGDGREYEEGGSYTFDDGSEYNVVDGEFVPSRELRDGEKYINPDGDAMIWVGGQSWHEADWRRQEATNSEYEKAHRESVRKELERRRQQALEEEAARKRLEADRQAEKEHQEFIQSLHDKYGTRTEKELSEVLGQNIEKNEAEAQRQNRRARRFEVAETAAKVIKKGADVAIDLGATVVPGGKYVKAGYTVAQGALEGYEGGLTVDVSKATRGAVKGGIDSAKDFLPSSLGKKATHAAKAGLTIAGETVGGDGFVNGVKKATIDFGTDMAMGGIESVIKEDKFGQFTWSADKGNPGTITISMPKTDMVVSEQYFDAIMAEAHRRAPDAFVNNTKVKIVKEAINKTGSYALGAK